MAKKNKSKKFPFKSIIAAASAIAGSLGLAFHLYTQTPQYILNNLPANRSRPYVEIVPGTEKDLQLDSQAHTQNLEKICAELHCKKSDILYSKPVSSVEMDYIAFDSEGSAQMLIPYAKNSIDSIFNYAGIPDLRPKNLHFQTPSKIADIKIEPGKMPVCFVSGIGNLTKTKYELTLRNGKRKFYDLKDGNASEGESSFRFQFETSQCQLSPIYVDTSSERIGIALTPAIEALHYALRPYTVNNFKNSINGIPLSEKSRLQEKLTETIRMEESLAHAISILWFDHYNIVQHLNFSSNEVQRSQNQYNNGNPQYTGVMPMLNKIKQIGIPQAVNLYQSDPKKLFEGISLK